jgi:hypothetical protein
MYAERLLIETDTEGNPCHLPKLPPSAKIELIVLVLEETQPLLRRQPPPSIAGKGKIFDDLIAPAVPESDWDALR